MHLKHRKGGAIRAREQRSGYPALQRMTAIAVPFARIVKPRYGLIVSGQTKEMILCESARQLRIVQVYIVATRSPLMERVVQEMTHLYKSGRSGSHE